MSVTTTLPTAYGQNGQNANNAFVLYQLMKFASIDIETLADWINNFPSGGIITTDIIGDVYAPNGTTKALENASANYTYAVSTPVLFGRIIDNEYRLGTGSAGSPLENAMASLQAMFGSLGIQGWGLNNTSLMDNMYLDGGGYRFTRGGSGTLVHFLPNEIAISIAPAGAAGAAAVLTRKVVIGANDLKIGTPTDNYYNCYFPYGGTDYLYSANNTPAFKHSFENGKYTTYYGAGSPTAINTPVTWTEQTKISLENGLEVVKGTMAIPFPAPTNSVTIDAQAGKITGILNYPIAPSSNIVITVINSFCKLNSIPIASFSDFLYTGIGTDSLLLSVGNVNPLGGSFDITIRNLSATPITISTDINFVIV